MAYAAHIATIIVPSMLMELSQPEQIALWDRRARMPDLLELNPDPELVERLEGLDPQHRQAVDIGCGCGRHLLYLARLGWRVTGVDWSEEALGNARRLLAEQGQVGTIVKGDFRRLPLESGRYALAIATNTLQHGKRACFRRAITELKRVLRPGGIGILSVPALSNAPPPFWGHWPEPGTVVLDRTAEAGLPHHFFSADELRAALAAFPRGVQLDLTRDNFPRGFEPYSSEQRNEWFWAMVKA
jgi:SAM-dependent methyltransferase